MKSHNEADETLDPEVERQLQAIDRALMGAEIEPDLAELATLTADLREQRPEPREDWQRELDERARAGFGRRPTLRERLSRIRVRGVLQATGAVVSVLLATVIIGGGIYTLSTPNGHDDSDDSGAATSADATLVPLEGGAATEGSVGNLNAPAGGKEAERASDDDGLQRTSREGAQNRKQDRSASLQLKTSTRKVREVSDEAIQITESVGGVVLSSQLNERGSQASADLQLSIPTSELDATLDRLTDLATVESLNEAAVDITEPFVSARDRLGDARDQRLELLEALGNATIEEQAEALRKQLREVRKEVSRAEARFDRIAQQARLSDVSLQVRGTDDDGESDDGWSLGDAIDDALTALEAVAGALLIILAVVLPLAITAALVTLIIHWARRRSRERALDE